MSSEPVIRAAGLGKAFRIHDQPADLLLSLLAPGTSRGTPFWALRDIDLTVGRGESVGIVGRNGSGKSTLLHLVCGIQKPSAGSVSTSGRIVGLLELGTGFNPDFTGRENALMTAAIYGLPPGAAEAKLPEIERFAGIGSFFERPVREYSTGMFARLAFAVCAHVDADILVVDEILAVGDSAFQQKCMRFLRGFRAAGGTLLFVSHGEQAVLSLCERAIWLDQGRLRADGASKDVFLLYAQSLEDTGSGFQTGGNAAVAAPRSGPDVAPPPAGTTAAEDAEPSTPVSLPALALDPDAEACAPGQAVIEHLGLHLAEGGAALPVCRGGENVELHIVCWALSALERPVVAYVLRNALGRIVFADDTGACPSRPAAAGERFTARFRFTLPYLLSGDHVFEAFLLAGAPGGEDLLARRVDQLFLTVQSPHIGGGLANIAPRLVWIDVNPPAEAAMPSRRNAGSAHAA